MEKFERKARIFFCLLVLLCLCKKALPLIDCDFQVDFCGYTQAKDDNFDWTRHKGSTASTGTGPSTDHTYGTAAGYYTYIETSSGSTGHKARLESPSLTGSGKHCIEFFYHMYGSTIGSLKVYAKTTSLGSAIWTQSGTKGDRWLLAQIPFDLTSNAKIVFEGLRGSSYTGDIAIDDVKAVVGSCPIHGLDDCDFEQDQLCGYTQDQTSDDFDWTRRKGSTPSAGTGPSVDASQRSTAGYYMFTEVTNRNAGEKARLISSSIDPNDWAVNLCWTFSYHMYGRDIGTLNVYMTGNAMPLWSRTGDMGNQWYRGQFQTNSNVPFTVTFEGVASGGDKGDIAIDGIGFENGACAGFEGSCDFEKNDCVWINSLNDDFDWVRDAGGTPSGSTGPSVDHTLGTSQGYYLFIEANDATTFGMNAILISTPMERGSTHLCLSFWYNMYGADIGSLLVYSTRDLTNPQLNPVLLWGRFGQVSNVNEWSEGRIPLNSSSTYRIEFEATRGAGSEGDIAIDDVLFNRQICTISPPNADPASFLTFDCNFEASLCGWTQEQTKDDFDWLVDRGGTPTSSTGPSDDHSSVGTGHYIFTESSSPQTRGDIARLISPQMSPENGGLGCFFFWYHMYGKDMGTLRVYFTTGGTGPGQEERLVWLNMGDRGNEWKEGFVQIQTSSMWKVIIEGEIAGVSYGDMAVDDVSYLAGECPDNGFCHFELDFCDWYQEKQYDDFDWKRGKGSETGEVGAPVDKTTNTAEGYFIYLDTQGRVDGDTAMLYSYNLTAGRDYCMAFWYFSQGESKLQILWRQPNAEDMLILWQAPISVGEVWIYQTVTGLTPDVAQVIIRGVASNQPNSRIALDEIYLNLGVCAMSFDCTFDEGYCGWQQDETDDFDWIRDSGGTPSNGTGPPTDHTPGIGGFYLYIESGSESKGEEARLLSPSLGPTTHACFEVWYHMYGEGTGTLNIFLQRLNSGTMSTLFSQSGNKGNVWLQARVDVSTPSDFRIEIEAVDGDGYTGDIAIDDIKLYPYLCNDEPPTQSPTTSPVYLPGFLDCDFEGNDLCLWSQVPDGAGDNFDWDLTTGSSDSVGTGPPADHTKQNLEGHYIHIDVSSQPQDAVARLISPVVAMDGLNYTDSCLEFWYHMYGPHVDTLNLLITDDPYDFTSAPVWTRSTNQGYDWVYEQIQISNMTDDFYYVFEGYAGSSYQGDIALDDIVVINGTCPGRKVCDFEVDDCGYVNDDNAIFLKFQRGSPRDNPGIDVRLDHTYGSDYGHFMFLEPRSSPATQHGLMTSPRYEMPQDATYIELSYWTVDEDGNSFFFVSLTFESASLGMTKVAPVEIKDSQRSASDVNIQGSFWRHHVVGHYVYDRYSGYYVSVYATFTNPATAATVAIDDIKVTASSTLSNPYMCSFETDTCSWDNTQYGDEFDWFRHSGGTASFGTGPSVDHTLGTPAGWYMYIDGSHQFPGARARLESALQYSYTGQFCIQFWYHMYGEDVGSLMLSWESVSRSYTLWSLSGNQGNQWLYESVSYFPPEDYRLVFEATTGAGISSDIAIDDVFYMVTCVDPFPELQFDCQASVSETIPSSQVCDWLVDCSTGLDEMMCLPNSFEGGLGRYTVLPYVLYPWINTTVLDGMGPQSDWSGNTTDGTYMMVDTANPYPAGQPIAVLVSPEIQQVYGSSCQISFWYYMAGDAGWLIVAFYATDNPLEQTVVARMKGNQGQIWQEAIVNLNRIAKPFQLVFSAIPSLGVNEIIAIDEIRESATNVCGPPVRQPSCQSGEWRCSNGACVSPDVQCDFTDDCGDFSDELQCSDVDSLRCSFETGLCLYSQSTNGQDDGDWLLTSGQIIDNVDLSAPTRDHTRNDIGGQFMYFDQSQPGVDMNFKVWLTSPSVTPGKSGGACVLKLWFYMWGDDAGTFNIYYRQNYAGPLVLLESYGQSRNYDFWQDLQKKLPWSGLGQVVFEGTGASGPDGSIAIDDISMLGDCTYSSQSIPGTPTTYVPPTGSTSAPECLQEWYICPSNPDICVTPAQMCDFYKNCPNSGEDESACGNCEYNNGDFCGAQNVVGWTEVPAGFYPQYPPLDANQVPTAIGNYLATFVSYSSLTTPMLGPSGSLCQFEMDYFMQGDPGYLEVYLMTATTTTLLMRVDGDQGSSWHHEIFFLEEQVERFQIQIVNQRFSSSEGQVAIDRLNYISCDTASTMPSKDANCTFESGTCGYYQLRDDDIDWTRHKGSTSSTNTGPSSDHTTESGYYMYIETSSPAIAYGKARLALHPQRPTDDQGLCLIFYYHMFGDTIDTLNVYLTRGTQSDLIFTKSQSQGNKWRSAQSHITTKSAWQVVFEASRGTSYTGDIAIDDVFFFPGICPISDTCTFESGLCSWTQDGLDDFDWSFGSNGKLTEGTGPSTDHTTASKLGVYLYANNQFPRFVGEVTRLFSTLYQDTSNIQCLKFYYIVYGDDDIGSLSVNVYDVIAEQFDGPLLEIVGSINTGWQMTRVSVTASHAYQIVIQAVIGSLSNGSIAIDDVTVSLGTCPRDGYCDFENDLCNWQNSVGDDNFDWIQLNGPTTSTSTGPSVDHTTGTNQGYYLYIETSSGSSGYKARLKSFYLPPNNKEFRCLYFWYHMYGSTMGTLRVLTKDQDGKMTTIWQLSGNRGNKWFQGQVNLYNEKQYQVIFEGVRGTGSTGDMAIDDLAIENQVCEDVGGDSAIDCTFNSDMCSYVQDGDFDWEVGVDDFNGPQYDHTTGSGSYVYLNMTVDHNSGDRARLVSPLQMPSSTGNCLTFWYHISGINVDRFAVYLRQDNTDSIIFTRIGGQGDEWIRGEKNIQQDAAWQAVFEGRYGTNDIGHIAFDDVTLEATPCSSYAECDFESGLCGWTQDSSDKMDWTRHKGSTTSSNTGPSTDHTTGTTEGYYIYLETSYGSTNYNARLYSPLYSYTDGDCFTMWYHMYGSSINTLNVKTYVPLTSKFTTLFQRKSISKNEWRIATMTIESAHSYQIILEALRGSSTYGDIAVDDVKLTSGPCPGNPGYCNFESGTCAWINDRADDDWDWERTRGLSGKNYNPGTDHTTNTDKGFYMSFPIIPPTVDVGDNAILISEYIEPIRSGCFKMWYHMTGTGTGTLEAYSKTGSTKYSIITLTGDAGNVWKLITEPFSRSSEFRLFIEATSSSDNGSGHIAIDDVDLEPVLCSNLTTPAPIVSNRPQPTYTVGIYDCFFEEDFCLWQLDPTGQTDWERTLGTTTTSDTGPIGDHTTGGLLGWFIHVDSSGSYNEQARIILPQITSGSQGKCIRFWYNMYGADVNTLNMIVRKGTSDTLMWTKTGNQGQNWLLGQVHATGTFDAIFEVVTGSGIRGDICLDDITFWDSACPAPDVCDFEDGPESCGITQDGTDEYDWYCTNGAAGKDRPDKDSTTGTSQGYYFLFNETTSTLIRDNQASFFSKQFSGTEFCLQFWYRTSGFSAKLDVYGESNGNSFPLDTFSKTEANSGRWHLGQIKIDAAVQFKIRFTGVLKLDDEYVAVDDIDFSKLTCSDLASTNFEDGFGTYVNLEGDDFDWIRHSGNSPNQNSGPDFDHTLGTDAGFYALLDTSPPRLAGEKAWLMTDTDMDIGQSYCMSVWYHMTGQSIGTLTLYQSGNDADYDEWKLLNQWDFNRGTAWMHDLVDIRTFNPLTQLVFEGVVGDGNDGDIALDDLQLFSGECTPPTVSLCVFTCDDGAMCFNSYSFLCNFVADCQDKTDEAMCGPCDFENGWCNYEELSTGSYKWTNSTGATPTSNTGPTTDHTLGTVDGSYLYVDASSGSGFSKATLRSPSMNQAAPGCLLTVWVHIHGTDIGELGIYITQESLKTRIYEIHDPLGPNWVQIQVGLGRLVGPFQIQFEAVRSFSVLGDIAIDDISFTGCSLPEREVVCLGNQFQCDSRGCISQSRVCDLTDDCGDNSDEMNCAGFVSCTFEYGLCTWQQLTNDELDWYWNTGRTQTDYTGPERDHTTGLATGHYLYLESDSPRKMGDRARLGSPNFRALDNTCEMRMYYHMFGDNIGSLNVYKRKVINGPLELLWSRQGNLGDFFERADIVLANNNDRDIFQIIIEATVGDGNLGDIAIDDISFTDSCQLRNDTFLPEVTTLPPVSHMTTMRPCKDGDFICKNGFCVGRDMRCDGTPDCLDGSDEDECGSCTFESDQCGWQVDPTGVYVWQRQRARDAPSSIAPATDHTTLGPNGYYMYVDQSQGTFGLAALLQSPPLLGDTGTRCQLEYWYHMYGGEAGSLVVSVYENLIPVSTMSLTGNQGQQWNRGVLDVGTKSAGRYYIRFEATPGGGFGDPDTVADIAVDDIAFINCGVSSDVSCDFGPANAKTFCGWQQDTQDSSDWILRTGDTPSYYTGPKGDHTTEGPGPKDYGTETYIYYEVSSGSAGDTCRLLSGSIKPTGDQEYCFSFWYHMYGSTIGELNVYISSAGKTDKLFHKRGTQEFKWLQGYRTIKTSNSFEIIMEGVRGPGFEGDIALDDLTYDPVPCPPPVECEFESDFCEWSNVDDDTIGFDWQRGMNGDPDLGTGPPVDHSSESTTAYFAFANVASMPELSEARLASPPFDRTGVQCLTFFYNIYGDDIGTLLVYQQDEGDYFISPSWEKSGDQGQYWRQAQVEISPVTGKTFQVYFEAVAGSSTSGYMALDDITVLPGVCPTTDFCTFEQNLCTWTNDFVNDDFDWIRDGAGTGSGGTGPDVDHTLNSARGFYMLIEATNKNPGDKAWFVSDRIPPTAGRCLDFWYHMYGSAVDTLNLYQQNVNSITATLIWTKTGNLGNVWLNAKVTIQETNEFWVFFEGIAGKNSTADIALDDIHIQDVVCSTTPAPPTTTTLPPTYAPDSHDCNFEQGFCLWNQDKTDDLDWTRKAGGTSSVDTGPSYDHTLGTSGGYYIYLETSTGSLDDYARLLSSSLVGDNQSQYCLEFYYHMYGPDINALSVYVRQGSDQLMWTKTLNQGDFWRQALVNIPVTGMYQVIFEATKGKSYKGDIAVDDIAFYLGTCPPSALCDFEFDDCGYTQSPTNDFSWNKIKAGDSPTDLKKDRSYQTSAGHYMYADFNGQPFYAKAAIISPDSKPTSGSCLNFFFAPVGDLDAGTLSVRRRSPSGAELEVWSTLIGRLHQWHLAQATVSSAQPGEKYSIIFEADRDVGSTNGGVAIDDIETQAGICPVTTVDCDFESGDICGWQQVDEPEDDFDWTVIKGSTSSSGTGPSKDHTLNSKDGHYAFIESSSPNLAGDSAQLLSPMFTGYYNNCLEFYFHMYGDDSGTFNIYRRVEDSTMVNVFTQSNNKGDVWRKGQVTMDDTVQIYDIVIEATVGGYQGDIAIDDIRVFDGVCPDEGTASCEIYCGSGEDCVNSLQICDFVSDCPNHVDEENCGYFCQFEDDLCGWTADSSGVFRWVRSRGELPADNTGPYIDHTTLSPLGYYMYVAPYTGSQPWASLTSPKVHNTATSCEMQFWTVLSGANVGYIDVVVINDFSSWTALKIDDETGENVWEKQVVYIGRQTGAVQVAIRSSRSFAVQGAIAVDDIVFASCDLPKPSTCPLGDYFQCDNQVCISSNQVCDYNDDCGDFSEEDDEDCPLYTRCNFEDGMCQYLNVGDDDDMDWQLATGTQTNPLPPFDHTLLRPGGSFMYVGNAAANANKARLAGPVFQGGLGKPCRMRLWFYNYGSSPGSLQIAYRTGLSGSDQVLATIDGPIGNYWERYELELNSAFDFQPMIIAVQNIGARSGAIAVDDITYTDECVRSQGTFPVIPPDGGTTVSPCGSGRWRCGDGGCVYRTQLCDYTPDCGDASDEAKCGQCDFDTDTCGYMDKSLGNSAWTRTSVLPSQVGAMDAGGSFMSVAAGTGVFDEPAILKSVVLPPTSAKCVLQFWFQFRDSDDEATFNVFLVDDDNPDNKVSVWYPIGTNSFWKQETVALGRQTGDFMIHFEALLSDENDVILLDDITMSDCAVGSYDPCEVQCFNGFCIPQSMECDFSDDCGDRTDEKICDAYIERCSFETDLCNWSQMDDDEMDWAWLTGSSGQQGGAPGWDHTTLTPEGSYLYLYSLTGDEFKKARLGSLVFLSSDCKMRFWYHMYGENVYKLSVLTKVSQSSDFSTKWTKSESQGEGWKRGEVILDDYSKFQVFIEGISGISYAVDDHIAIDDVSFTPGCQLDPENTLPISVTPTPSYNCETGFKACKANEECIPSSKFCDFKFDCVDGSDEEDCPSVCDFEDDMCGWYQDPTDDTNWQIYDSDTTSGISVPVTDHTTNHIDGKYIYVDGTISYLNQHARLISPTYGQTGNTCSMSFWYYIFGDDYGTLSVILTLTSGGQDRVLAEITTSTDYTNKWVRQDVIMPTCVSEFQIILDALNQQNSPRSGGFAVDDIRFDTCEYTISAPSCGSGYSQCTSGQCYPTLSQCDFTNDCCQDSSDELSCDAYERCSFNSDMCSWTNMVGSDELDWQLTVAETSSGPSYDHTTDSKSGIYIIMGPSGAGYKAQLKSLAFTPVTSNCYIRLFVFLDDSGSSINIFTRTQVGGPLTFVWGSSGSTLPLQSWVKLQVPISSSETFEVVLEAVLGSEAGCVISVDDISFTPACVPSPSSLPNPTTGKPRTEVFSTTVKGPIVTTSGTGNNGGDSNKVIFIIVGVIGGLVLVVLVIFLVAYFRQRQQQTKGDPGFDGIGNPAYGGDTQMSDFKISSADNYPLDAHALEDKDGFTNAGFEGFGEGEA